MSRLLKVRRWPLVIGSTTSALSVVRREPALSSSNVFRPLAMLASGLAAAASAAVAT